MYSMLDLLHGTTYRSNFVAHPLTARFVVVLKHFPSDSVFYSLYCSSAYFSVRRLWMSERGRHGKCLID